MIQTAFIGDVILATGLIEKLRQYFPEAQLDFLLRKGNEGVLQGHPYLNKVWIWDKKKGKYRHMAALIAQIREEKYDMAVNLQRFASMGLLTALSGAKQTIGFDKNPFSLFFTKRFPHRIDEKPHVTPVKQLTATEKVYDQASHRAVEHRLYTHEIERNHALIRDITDTIAAKPHLYPVATDYAKIKAYQHAPYICIAPTSVWFTKQFPEEKWVELMGQLPAEFHIYLLGSPSDKEACQRIIATSDRSNTTNLAGELSLLASAALMEGAAMNYVNDSAPMHLASARNAPVCAIYCSTIPGFGFGPLSDQSFIVERDEPLYCRPCGLHGYKACPEGHFKCAKDIRIEQLMHSFQ